MAVDLNAVAAQGIANIKTAIDSLNALKITPGADVPGIVAQVEALVAQQTAMRDLALQQIEQSPTNAAAIAKVNAAAANLKGEAGNITTVASALTTAVKVVGYATDLAKALAVLV